MNKQVETPKNDKGFTLVELLIVIVILGILAAVTVFAVRGITDKSQTNSCATEKRAIETATEAYFADTGGDAPSMAALVVGFNPARPSDGYLRTDPSARFTLTPGSPPTITGVNDCAPPATTP